jgi:hypothetical protein
MDDVLMVTGDPKPERREDLLISRKIGRVEQALSWSMSVYLRGIRWIRWLVWFRMLLWLDEGVSDFVG